MYLALRNRQTLITDTLALSFVYHAHDTISPMHSTYHWGCILDNINYYFVGSIGRRTHEINQIKFFLN